MNKQWNPSFAPDEAMGRSPYGDMARAVCAMWRDSETGLVYFDGKIINRAAQVVTVGKAETSGGETIKSGGDFGNIQSAIDSIPDAASDKIYTVLVYPGEYDEAITLGDYIDIVAVNPKATKILQQVTDNNVECHCYLEITIESFFGNALRILHASSVITAKGDFSSTDDSAIYHNNGTLEVEGTLTSSQANGIQCNGGVAKVRGAINKTQSSNGAGYGGYANGGVLILENLTITVTDNDSDSHSIAIGGGTCILQNVRTVCTHANSYTIYAATAKNVYCYDVYGNRPLYSNITNLVANGFHLADGTNTDVESITATSGGVAADLNVLTTLITTNGDEDEDNVTLADGQVGQVKKFAVIAEGHVNDTIKITPANLNGGTQITFSATPVGEGCEMLFDGTSWNIAANNGGTIA